MERANMVNYLASSADELVSAAESAETAKAIEMLREAAELIALGSVLLHKNEAPQLTVITKEAA